MDRPTVKKFKTPQHIDDYPCGPCYEAGHLVTENASWRTEKPIIDKNACVNCLICYMCCPDGVIFKDNGKVDIDYSFCKGCGICAKECKCGAIKMVKED
jgi:pyruvate ferredoxin oxidoreductase delta subunit